MKRRDFLKALMLCVAGWGITPDAAAGTLNPANSAHSESPDDHIRDYLHKMKFFDESHDDDIWITEDMKSVFNSTVMRLRRLEEVAGHGNFQIVSLDDGLSIAARYSDVGEFTGSELDFMEMIFQMHADKYGFFGQKPLKSITARINENDVVKVPYTGNHLYKGKPLETYHDIRRQAGEDVILTSGVRGIMKQFLLFLNKAYSNEGNLSLASRSLAPPGYSFHGNGDFDVGQVGFGAANFTTRFTTTEVYKKLSDLGYLKLRYPQNNMLGVRFEPWHIKTYSV
jgi:D-alanyl-D-alanine carboxypeptidase